MKNNIKIVMRKDSLLAKVSFMFMFGVCSVAFGQKNKLVEKEEGKIVFGKVYTLEELKQTEGIIRCSSTEYEEFLQKKYPERINEGQFENWLQPLIKNAAAKSQNGDVITIPVVVHVIHSGENYGAAPNITDAQVASQILAMNNDFRKMSGTRGFNTDPVGADVKIQFALAKVDPNGNPTNGIDRVNMCKTSWSTEDIDDIVKPQTIWDPTQYMNMWSVNFSNTGLLGYAQFPTSSGLPGVPTGGTAYSDGVVAGYWCFGSNDYNDGTFALQQSVNLGRTMTHEVGHFLGLRHLWGDGNCLTDYCDDTPFSSNVNNAHYNCNTSQDSCPTMPGKDMVRNYMNYTYDACMNIFTNDQKARMLAVMNNSPRRASLKTSMKDVAIPLFPNDAELKAERICSSSSSDLCESSIVIPFNFSLYNRGTSPLTSAVISYSINGGAMQTYNWSGNLSQDKYAIISINAPENSTINAYIQTVNGVADQRSSNNSTIASAGAFITTPSTVASTVNFTLQPDFYGTETTWTLKNSNGTVLYSGGPYNDGVAVGNQIVSLPPIVTQTWSLAQDCYTFTINDSEGDGIEYYGYYNIKDAAGNVFLSEGAVNFGTTQSKSFKVVPSLNTKETSGSIKNNIQIYPNPATNVLNITKVSSNAKFEIFSTAGQLVKSGVINNNQVKISEFVKGTYFITIKDGETNQTIKFIKE